MKIDQMRIVKEIVDSLMEHPEDFKKLINEITLKCVDLLMKKTKGNKSQAAKRFKVSRAYILDKIYRYRGKPTVPWTYDNVRKVPDYWTSPEE